MRLVLDTNILVAGLISSKGPPGRLLQAWLDGRFELVSSREQIDELRRVLNYERLAAYIRPDQASDFVENVEVLAVLATDLPHLELSPDPDDNVILATAVAGEANAVVSGDKTGVLDLGDVEGIPIVSAREAAEWLRSGSE